MAALIHFFNSSGREGVSDFFFNDFFTYFREQRKGQREKEKKTQADC